MPYYDVGNLVTVTMTNMTNTIPCDCGPLRTTAVRISHQVPRGTGADVSDSREVSLRPALSSQVLSKSPADLGRGLSSSKV